MSPSEKLHSGCISDCLSQLGCPIRISSSSRVFLLPWRFWWRKMKVKSYLNVYWKLNSQFEKTNCSNLCHWSCPSPNLPHIQDLNIQLWPGSSGHMWGLSSCGGDQVHIWAPSSVFSHHLLLLAHWCQHTARPRWNKGRPWKFPWAMEFSMGHGNFHGPWKFPGPGIFHGPWKFPWGMQVSRPWKFPGPGNFQWHIYLVAFKYLQFLNGLKLSLSKKDQKVNTIEFSWNL